MNRSTVNQAVLNAEKMFINNGWYTPPEPKWDITDFGLGDFNNVGLVLINLAEEKEYCEKLMYARKDMTTPCHAHKMKKEDIIVRNGKFAIQVWKGESRCDQTGEWFQIKINGSFGKVFYGDILRLISGERVRLVPGIYHEFYQPSDECIIGEVSTANDDTPDNYFFNKDIGRFLEINEDKPPVVKLMND